MNDKLEKWLERNSLWVAILMFLSIVAVLVFYGAKFSLKAHASVCYQASGWGVPSANGLYEEVGTYNSYPFYQINGINGAGPILYWYGAYYSGNLDHTTDGTVSGIDLSWWYNNTNTAGDPTTGLWNSGLYPGGGTVGTFTLASCGGGGTSTDATSTPSQVQQNLFYGFILFMISFGWLIFYFPKHKD